MRLCPCTTGRRKCGLNERLAEDDEERSCDMEDLEHGTATSRNSVAEGDVSEETIESLYGEASFGVDHGHRQNGEQFFQSNEDRYRHTVIVGATGTGKSNHMMQLERQDILSGAGVIIVAAHDEDAVYPASCVPSWRERDTVVVDFGNAHFLPNMNPLDVDCSDEGQADKVVSDVIRLVTSSSMHEWAGPRFEQMARMAFLLLLDAREDEPYSVADARRCFTDPEFVKSLLARCDSKEVFDYWTKEVPGIMRSNDAGELVDWFTSKLADFTTDVTLRAVFGRGSKTLDIADIVDNGKILIALVPEERIGAAAARRIRTWITMQLKDAIMRRGRTSGDDPLGAFGPSKAEAELSPLFVYFDEFEKFADPLFASLLSESRKRNVGFVLSFQNLSQMRSFDIKSGTVSEQLLDAILGNAGTFVCYRLGSRDTAVMSAQLGVSVEDLNRIRLYHPFVSACAGNPKALAEDIWVLCKPKPLYPKAPARLANHMIFSGVWLPLDESARKYATWLAFCRIIKEGS